MNHIGERCAVDDVDYHSAVGDALMVLIGGLTPFVERVLSGALPPGVAWTELLRRKDAASGRRGGVYRSGDLSLMLRVMTERLGDIGFPFSRHLSRQAQNYASELRDVRNRWAHNEKFTAAEAYRAIDTAELLLRAIGEEAEAAQVAQLKLAVSPPSGTKQPVESPPNVAGAEQVRLAPPSVPTAPPSAKPTADAPRIQIHAVADLSYAMAHCRIPVIDHITVDNTGGDLRSAVIEVDVVSADGSHGGPQEVFLDLAAHKPTILRNVDLKLDPASMLQVDEQRPGAIRVVLRDAAGDVLAEAVQRRQHPGLQPVEGHAATARTRIVGRVCAAQLHSDRCIDDRGLRPPARLDRQLRDRWLSEREPGTRRRHRPSGVRRNASTRHPLRRAACQLGQRWAEGTYAGRSSGRPARHVPRHNDDNVGSAGASRHQLDNLGC